MGSLHLGLYPGDLTAHPPVSVGTCPPVDGGKVLYGQKLTVVVHTLDELPVFLKKETIDERVSIHYS